VTIMEILAHDGKLPLVGWLVRLWPERLMMGLALPSSFVLAGYTGVLLGTTSIPVWYTSPLLGALFMSGSLASGAAAVSLATTLTGRGAYEDHRTLASLELTLGAAEMAVLGGYVITSGEA